MDVRTINEAFINYFKYLSYNQIYSIPVSSRVDTSVRFIGSAISLLKPHILSKNIPYPGFIAIQKCFRTRYLDKYFDREFIPARMSIFYQCGLFSIAESSTLLEQFYTFLSSNFPNSMGAIEIDSWHEDYQLHELLKYSGFAQFPINKRNTQINSFRHKYGNDIMFGKNVNLIYKSSIGGELEIANIIEMEYGAKEKAIEISIGSNMLLQAIRNEKHILATTSLKNINLLIVEKDYCLQDCLLVVCNLFMEGLRPKSTSSQGKVLRSYLKILAARVIINECSSHIEEIIKRSMFLEFGISDENIVKEISTYIKEYTYKISSDFQIKKEDEKILNLIKRNERNHRKANL